jgi:Tfp pilus assembly protein PilX
MGQNDSSKSVIGLTGLGNENGVALVLVLIMLLLLSILGATMLASSTSELKITGNYRNGEVSFYTAEAAVSFALTYSQIYTTLFGATTVWPAANGGVVLDPNTFAATGPPNTNNPNYNNITIPGTTNTADVKVEFLSSGKLPPGTGSQEDSGLSPGSGFKANNFAVSVIAYGPNNSQAQVESQVAKIVQQ